MRIYISHSKELDYLDVLYHPLRESQLNTEHEIILPHELHVETTQVVSRDILRVCDLCIAEVSYSATGLGIELGWADAFDCPILCIYKSGSKVSGSLKVITKDFIEYESREDMIERITQYLILNKGE